MTIPETFHPYFDILIVAILVFVLWRSYHKGLLLLVLESIRLFVAFFLAWLLASPLAQAMPLYQADEALLALPIIGPFVSVQINGLLWFVIVFILVSLILLLLKPIFAGVGKVPLLKGVNHILGLIFGFFQVALYSFLIYILLLTPLLKNGQDVLANSQLRHMGPLTSSITKSMNLDEVSLLKIFNPDSIIAEDEVKIKQWLSDRNVETIHQDIILKIIKHDQLSEDEIAVLRTWLSGFALGADRINELIEGLK